MAMVVAVAAGVVCVLVLLAATIAVRYVRRPGLMALDPASVALPSEPVAPQIRILRSPEELNAAIERASTTEATLAEMASKRAERYTRFTGRRDVPGPRDLPGPPRDLPGPRDGGAAPRVTRLRIGDEPLPPASGTAEPGM
jgi:hypothetical protein